MPARILIVGGTRDARDLAAILRAEGFDTIVSLAGVTASPAMPAGMVRSGGFGGVDGLVQYLRDHAIAAIADATHPFAVQMSRHACLAAAKAGIPILRLERPAWVPSDGDDWRIVDTVQDAAAVLPDSSHPLVTVGRKEIGHFFARSDVSGVARMIEDVGDVPAHWQVLRARPPFTLESELALLGRHAISHLVTKNSGSPDTAAKLVAAREKKIPVIMVARPPKPAVPAISVPQAAPPLLRRLLSP